VNLHHRAALGFWTSTTHEKLGDLQRAFESSLQSTGLWRRQISTEPTNPSHVTKYLNALDRAVSLANQAQIDFSEAYLKAFKTT
jgi:hypothetical protein